MEGKMPISWLHVSSLILLGLACGREGGAPVSQNDAVKPPVTQLGPVPLEEEAKRLAPHYQSCGELQADVRKQLLLKQESDKKAEEYWEKVGPIALEEEAMESVASEPSAADAEGPDSITNVQESGVDEQDFVKVNASTLYVLRQDRLEVIDRKSLKPIGSLSLQADFSERLPEDAQKITPLKMYSDGDRLVIIGQVGSAYSNTRSSQVKVLIFRSQAGALPQKISEQAFVGTYLDSRFMDHHLYLVIRDELQLLPGSMTGSIPAQPIVSTQNRVQGVACSSILKSKIPDLDFSLTKVISLKAQNPSARPQQVASLGASGQIYMSRKHIYTTKSGIYWQPWTLPGQAIDDESVFNTKRDSLFIDQIAIDSQEGKLKFAASGEVQGYVGNQFYFKEYLDQDVLAVATTSYVADLRHGAYPGQVIGDGLNHLWILQKKGRQLKVVNGLYHYGKPGEDLRAVRFSGKYAYMVTFKKTDPLYAFDMSQPLKPRLLGELFIPGFSMYLHPVGDDQLVGVGYDADDQGDFAWFQGIQVSLFDARNPLQLKRVDNRVHGQRGSYSDVTGDHHAFFFDAASDTFTLPVVELSGKEGEGGSEYASELKFSGAVAYQVAGQKLIERGRISHKDLIPPACLPMMSEGIWWQSAVNSMDVNRLIKLDGRWISISRFGLKVHDEKADFRSMRTVGFAAIPDICSQSELTPLY